MDIGKNCVKKQRIIQEFIEKYLDATQMMELFGLRMSMI